MNDKPLTLRALAEQLNIHVSTVSRVLQGDEDKAAKAASKDTIAKIKALAKASGYTHNPYALSLRTNQSHLVGVSVPRLSDIIWATVYEGIEDVALASNYQTYVTNSYDDIRLQKQLISLHRARWVAGLIIGDAHNSREYSEYLRSIPGPFVLTFRKAEGYPSVVCDDYLGGQLAARHLLERGHRAVGLHAGLRYAPSCLDRAQGFIDRFRAAGFPLSEQRIFWGEIDTEGGRRGARKLLADNTDLTAMFLVNDFAAIGAMGAMREVGLSPGVTMALIGYNDTPLASALPIPLTTIRNPLHELGRKSMELLLSMLKSEACESVVMRPELVVRESSDSTDLSLL